MKRRFLSILLTLCLVLSMLPPAVFATAADDFLGTLDSGFLNTLDSGVPDDEVILFCRLYLLAQHAAEQPDATQEQQARLERLEDNFEKAFSPIRERWEEFTDLSSAEREDETVLAEYADTIRTYRAVDRMLSGDYDCTCAQRCTEGEHSADCLRCVIDGIDGCTGEAVCICTTKCHDLDSGAGINPECPVCSAKGADLDAVCKGAPQLLTLRMGSVEAAWGLAKADGAAPDSWVGTGTLADAMNYAMYLYSGTAYIRLFSDADTTATIDIPSNKTTILDLNGHTIDAKQGAFSVLSVRGDLTLHDTSAGGTGKITGGNTPFGGGGVSVSNGGNLTMTGGSITGNAAYDGGGVNLQGGARFIMTGGTITGNTTKMGGGIYAMPEAAFTMTGGSIAGNTASMGAGGVYVDGAYDEVAAAQMTVGGTARITGNQINRDDKTIVSNVQLPDTAILTISSSTPLAEGAAIGAYKYMEEGDTTADVTGTNGSDVSGYFTSDSDKRSIQNGTGNIVQLVAAPTYEAQWRERSSDAWTSGTLAEAVNFANTLPEAWYKAAVIRLLSDVTTTQTLEFVKRDTTTILDLNGKTIDANGGAFPVLTLRHNFVLTDDSTTDVTKQGKITGSNNTDGIGGGIAVEIGQGSFGTTDQSSFTIQGGNITGNTAKDGGGIGVDARCNFIMNGGNVSGNTATSNGGGSADLPVHHRLAWHDVCKLVDGCRGCPHSGKPVLRITAQENSIAKTT